MLLADLTSFIVLSLIPGQVHYPSSLSQSILIVRQMVGIRPRPPRNASRFPTSHVVNKSCPGPEVCRRSCKLWQVRDQGVSRYLTGIRSRYTTEACLKVVSFIHASRAGEWVVVMTCTWFALDGLIPQ